jgi:hypothetical protein
MPFLFCCAAAVVGYLFGGWTGAVIGFMSGVGFMLFWVWLAER